MDLNIAVVDDLEIDCERIEKCTQQYFLDRHKTANIVERYGGTMEIETHNGIFNVSILMYAPD